MTIKYIQSKVSERPTFRTEKFGNLLSDTYQAQVEQSTDGTWSGWLFNWSNKSCSEFRLGFGSKGAATRWANEKLKGVGVNA